MKKTVAFLIVAVMLCVALGLVACNPTEQDNKDIVGVILSSKTFEYDGQKHSLTVEGTLPKGAEVVYTYDLQGVEGENQKVDGVSEVGEYKVKAVITCKGYNERTLTATLKIIKGSFAENLSLPSKYFAYDKNNVVKYKLEIEGDVPADTQISYKYKNVYKSIQLDPHYDENYVPSTDPNGVSEEGRYQVEFTLTKVGYDDPITLEGILEIYTETFRQTFSLPNDTVIYEKGKQFSLPLYIGSGDSATPVTDWKQIQCSGILYISTTYNGEQCPYVETIGTYKVVITFYAYGYRSVTREGYLTVISDNSQS